MEVFTVKLADGEILAVCSDLGVAMEFRDGYLADHGHFDADDIEIESFEVRS